MKIDKHILLLILVTFLLYFPALFNGFVWDDEEQIVNNVQITASNFVENAFSGAIFNNGGSAFINNYYRPLMITSFGILVHLFGKNPFWFHFFQISLHTLNVCLLYYLFGKGLKAFLPALIFAVHPLNVESVVYVAATGDTLCLFFILLTLLKINSQIAAGLFTLLALLSKESGIIIIKLGIFLNYKKYFLPACIAFISYLILRFGVGHTGFGAGGIFPMQNADLLTRLQTIQAEIFYYFSNFILPHNLTIAQHWLITTPSLFNFWLLLIVEFVLLFALIRSKNYLFLIFFGFSFAIVLNLFPLDNTVASRWFYLPMVGLLGMLAPVLWRFKKIILVWILFLGILSLRRSLEWRSALTLFSADIINNPESFDLQNNLGTELYRAGQYQEAKPHFQKSADLNPKWWVSWNNLCAVADREGNYDTAKKYCEVSIANGNYYLAYENLAKLLYFHFDKEAGIEFAKESLKKLPNDLVLREISLSK